MLFHRERDDLLETLSKHKSILERCQQREFEAYTQVKISAEAAENAKLEKAEVSEPQILVDKQKKLVVFP